MFSNFYTYENEAQINIDLKCPICLDPFQLPFYDASCGHIFCFQCLKTWLKQKQSCPICRRYFTKFMPITDERLLKELDCLSVQCMYCNETHIKRSDFKDHITCKCSKRIVSENEEDFEYLLKRINASIENHRRQRENYEQANFDPLPIWIVLISGAHLFIYLSILIPIAGLWYITDTIFCPVLNAISWLIRFIK